MNGTIYDVIIIGSGPAGLTAGLYAGYAKMRTLILEKEKIGGELMNRDLIENYPSYPDGILGPVLGSGMMNQAIKYGAETQLGEVKQVKINGSYKVVKTSEMDYRGQAIIIAGGTHHKKLGIHGEQKFADKGVFYCAICDGPRFADKVVAVAGGGNAGITEALFLARFVSKVIVIEILPSLTAFKMLQERAFLNPKIEIKCGVKIEEIHGDDHVRSLGLLHTKSGQREVLEVDGVLVQVGLEPNTDYLRDTLPLDEKGQILVNEKMETEIPGVFAAGDIQHNSSMQIVTAAGDGATAVLSLEKYLRNHPVSFQI